MNYLYTWGNRYGIDIDRALLSGQGLDAKQIRTFGVWLEARGRFVKDETRKGKKQAVRMKVKSFNGILTTCQQAFVWFTEQFAQVRADNPAEHKVAVATIVQAERVIWAKLHKKTKAFPVAPDLAEEEIARIERFLKPENRMQLGVSKAVACRDYLFWRLAIEMGLRRGEILALRIQDCPRKYQPYLKIIRIEERGEGYLDPRDQYAPRPKTLSRDLGFVLNHSPLPYLINDYITRYRLVPAIANKYGGRSRIVMPKHEFLLIDHRTGEPLSRSSADGIARQIREGAGVSAFHWHIARHAFFNRAYNAVVGEGGSHARLMDLVTYGGWKSDQSLEIYTKRARGDRARYSLCFWQEGQNEWTALN